MKIAEFGAEVLLATLSNLGKINAKFADIDLALFDEDIRVSLMKSLFEGEFAPFSSKMGLQLHLEDICFQDEKSDNYEKEIGVTIVKNKSSIITFNLRLNNDLLSVLNIKFEKIEPTAKELDDNLTFQWYLEIGNFRSRLFSGRKF
jgi:hypothetical protein